jgi:hypothetical protein
MCAQSSRQPMQDVETTHYRSYTSQLKGLELVAHHLGTQLKNYEDKKNLKANVDSDLEQVKNWLNHGPTANSKGAFKLPLVRKNETKAQSFRTAKRLLVQALYNDIGDLYRYYDNIIRSKKENKDTTGRNNLLINAYLNSVKGALKTAEFLFEQIEEGIFGKPQKSALKNAIESGIKICDEQLEALKYAADVNCLEVYIPVEEYKKMKKDSVAYFFEGSAAKTVGKVAASSLLAAGSAAAVVAQCVFPPTLLVNLATGFIPLGLTAKTLYKSAKYALASADNVGFSTKMDIPPEWISRTFRDESGNEQINPNFHQEREDVVKVYLLEARDPQEIFVNGTNHDFANKVNNQGNVIFIEAATLGNPSLAAVFDAYDKDKARVIAAAMALASGQRYDKLGGWLTKDWTEKERVNVHLEFLLNQRNNLSEEKEEKVANVAVEGVAHRSSVSVQRPPAYNPASIPEDLQQDEGLESNVSVEGVQRSGSEEDVPAETETYEGEEGVVNVEEEQPSASPRRDSVSLFGLKVASSDYDVPEGRQEKHSEIDFEPGMAPSEDEEVEKLNKAFDQIPKRKISLIDESREKDAAAKPKKEHAEGEVSKKVIIKR